MACSRRESQSRPIIPTPASGCRVISHPVHRWPRSSRIPGWVYQHGGNTVDGIRYVRRNQTSHRDNPSRVSAYAAGSRSSQQITIGTGGACGSPPKTAGSNAGAVIATAGVRAGRWRVVVM